MGMSQAEISAGLLATNQARCEPPLDGREVERIAASVARYEPDGITVALAENHYDQMFNNDEPNDGPAVIDPGPVPDDLLRMGRCPRVRPRRRGRSLCPGHRPP